MYCPNCGAANAEDVIFCRSCGLDVSGIARAMEKHLPYKYLNKIDLHLLNEKKVRLYDSILIGLAAITFFITAFYLWRWGYLKDALFFIYLTFYGAISAVWYFLIYIRSRAKTKLVETHPDKYYRKDFAELGIAVFDPPPSRANELPAANTAEFINAPPSVTERTTKLFDTREK